MRELFAALDGLKNYGNKPEMTPYYEQCPAIRGWSRKSAHVWITVMIHPRKMPQSLYEEPFIRHLQ